ncbi:MAG: hypothetical protein K8H87_03000, partial [Pseudorhodoplanes sp.]|nr:hypothetical protein [Pseudorhodoplanes sp.]
MSIQTAPFFLRSGGGSGYLTHFLLHKLPHARAYIIDLPEVLELGRRNLERLGTADRVTFLTPDQGEQVSIFHIAMNTASFQEMPPSEIARYFDLMRSKRADSQSAFYCCNRVEKWLSDKIESSDTTESERGYAVRFMEYPWGTEQILFHRPSQMHGKLKMQPCLE